MRNLEDIEKDLAAAREALALVEGTPAEVYSRIVGYYRSVRNWNRGKREEYGERRLYLIRNDGMGAAALSPSCSGVNSRTETKTGETAAVHSLSGGMSRTFIQGSAPANEERLLLFVRASCPGCASAKAAVLRLAIPVTYVSADTAEGLAEAARRNVLATPTAILLSPDGREIGRARDAETIGKLAACRATAELAAV